MVISSVHSVAFTVVKNALLVITSAFQSESECITPQFATAAVARPYCCFRDFSALPRTRRVWLPNVQWKKIYSDALDKQVRVRVSTYALRCIDKAGGLDNYLLTVREGCVALCIVMKLYWCVVHGDCGQTKPEHLQSEFGEDLRVKVLLAMFEKQSVEPLAEAKDATIEKA